MCCVTATDADVVNGILSDCKTREWQTGPEAVRSMLQEWDWATTLSTAVIPSAREASTAPASSRGAEVSTVQAALVSQESAVATKHRPMTSSLRIGGAGGVVRKPYRSSSAGRSRKSSVSARKVRHIAVSLHVRKPYNTLGYKCVLLHPSRWNIL